MNIFRTYQLNGLVSEENHTIFSARANGLGRHPGETVHHFRPLDKACAVETPPGKGLPAPLPNH